jgi:hypothetical protein
MIYQGMFTILGQDPRPTGNWFPLKDPYSYVIAQSHLMYHLVVRRMLFCNA